MAVNLIVSDIAIAALDSLISLPQQSSIGGITVDTTIEEAYEDTLEITEHPVEAGTQISDHAFKRPMALVMRCGWSDSNPIAAGNSLSGSLSSGSFTGGSMAASDYVAGIYSQLLQLQESRVPFQVISGLRSYDQMMFSAIYLRRDQRSRFAIMVEAELTQVIIVSTQTANIAPQASQADPASTAQLVTGGSQQLQAATPAPGGSLPSSQWSGVNLISR